MITIVNYGMGNLGSIQNMFKRLGVQCQISDDPGVIAAASKILLPGVGAFDSAMKRIREGGFYDILEKKARVEKIPILGICLGMQLLTNSSEEGKLPGFGWIPARTLRFKFPNDHHLKVPHMGWNVVRDVKPAPLTLGFPTDARFYFVHSYYVTTEDARLVLAKTHYGFDFDSIVQHENIYGAQFHPEKSHTYGMILLSNFASL
jgi:glutamine amidotransferase